MWVRVARFEGGDTEKLRERAGSEGMPETPPGMLGAMILANEGGRLFLAYFDGKESLDAAAQHFEAMGDQIPEEVRGRRVSVDAYEVVVNTWEQ